MAEIYTYGGGEVLFKVFKGISMLMNGQRGEIFRPMMLMGGSVGAIWAIGKAFWESSLEGLVSKWFLPMIVILAIFMIPSETVHIIDALSPHNRYNPVDHVPLGLSRPAQVISSIGYALTRKIEHILAVPEQLQYNKTGMIFGGDSLLEASQYAITDERLASSMRHFVENCIVYDLCFSLYTMDDLKNTPNIWDLVKNRTSRVRLFSFCEQGARRCELVSCREGAAKLEALLKVHREHLSKHHVYQFLPDFYEHVTRVAQSAQNLISQQVMIHTIADGIDQKCDALNLGTNLAVNRAYLQQRHTYEVIGALAAKALVVLRNVFEALIYASFIFVMPFSLMPLGFRIFLKWLSLLMWIQLWPPFYAILNSGILGIAQAKAQGMLGINSGFTLMAANNLHNLAMDMHVYASYLSLSVPFLSYGLLQGGISSFVHLSSSITGVSQAAGSAAAQDQTTGNYSYGNVQLGNYSAFNETMLQNQLAPSLQMGFYQENRGANSTIYSQDGRMIMHDPQSQLFFDINMAQNMSSGLQRSADDAVGHAQKAGESFTESTIATNRALGEWTKHRSNSTGYSEILAHGTDERVSTVSQKALEVSKTFGERHGMGETESFEFLANVSAGMGIPGLAGAHVGFGHKTAADRSAMYEDAQNTCERESFSETRESLINTAKNEQANTSDEKGERLSQQIARSHDESEAHQRQREKHLQQEASLRETANWVEQNSVVVNRKGTDKFIQFVAQEPLSDGEMRGNKQAATLIRTSPEATDALLKRFVNKEEETIKATLVNPYLATKEGFQEGTQNLKNRPINEGRIPEKQVPIPLDLPDGKNIETEHKRLKDLHTVQVQSNQDHHGHTKERLNQTHKDMGATTQEVVSRSPEGHMLSSFWGREKVDKQSINEERMLDQGYTPFDLPALKNSEREQQGLETPHKVHPQVNQATYVSPKESGVQTHSDHAEYGHMTPADKQPDYGSPGMSGNTTPLQPPIALEKITDIPQETGSKSLPSVAGDGHTYTQGHYPPKDLTSPPAEGMKNQPIGQSLPIQNTQGDHKPKKTQDRLSHRDEGVAHHEEGQADLQDTEQKMTVPYETGKIPNDTQHPQGARHDKKEKEL